MFDRFNDLPGNVLGGSGDIDARALGGVLQDGEEILHVLASDHELKYTTPSGSTRATPEGDATTYMVVTDERVLYVFGDRPDAPEVEVDLSALTTEDPRVGVVQSTLRVETETKTVLFKANEADVDDVVDYLGQTGASWLEVRGALETAQGNIATFEERCRAGEATGDAYRDAESNLDRARRAADRVIESQASQMNARIDEVAAAIERRRVEAWVDRAAERIDTAQSKRDRDEYADACEACGAAADALAEARDAAEDVDVELGDLTDRLDDLEATVDEFCEQFLAETNAVCERALEAGETATAVDTWETAFDRYSAAVETGWNGHTPVSGEALELQLTWVTARLLDALDSRAATLEQRGDECESDDEAREYYDDALSRFEQALTLADDHPERSTDEFAAATERVQDKRFELSEWQFGNV